jgi:hypothetical protein
MKYALFYSLQIPAEFGVTAEQVYAEALEQIQKPHPPLWLGAGPPSSRRRVTDPDDPYFESETFRQDRHIYGERRIVALGEIEGEVFVVVYTWRGTYRRIISARRANRRERDAYRQTYSQRNS